MQNSLRITFTPPAVALLSAALVAFTAPRIAIAETPLHEGLGGPYPITMVVNEFIDRLLVNDTLNANPANDEACKRVPPAGFKDHATSFAIQAAGGPGAYVGGGIEEARAHLHITEKEWRAMVAAFRAVLYAFNVSEAEQQELIDLVAMVKEDVVSAPLE